MAKGKVVMPGPQRRGPEVAANFRPVKSKTRKTPIIQRLVTEAPRQRRAKAFLWPAFAARGYVKVRTTNGMFERVNVTGKSSGVVDAEREADKKDRATRLKKKQPRARGNHRQRVLKATLKRRKASSRRRARAV